VLMLIPWILKAMKAFVVNLARRVDRLNRMKDILPSGLDAEFTTHWEGPLDGKTLTLESLADLGYGLFPWRIESDNPWWSRPLKKGEIGCAISHWLCWKQAKQRGYDVCLFLEDDVYFAESFLPRLKDGLRALSIYDPTWDLVYLGRVPLMDDEASIKGFVKPGYSHCTFAYVLTLPAIEKMLQTSYYKDIIPVDEFLPAMYIDHPRSDVRRRYRKCLSAYAFEPPLAFQLPKSVAGSDTEESDFIGLQ